MGVDLAPVIVKHGLRLEDLRGKTLSVDANNFLYQFIALIRTPEGFPLKGLDGTVTSHLAGLLYRSTRLIYDYGIGLIFVFDGKPARYKEAEVEKRREIREKAMQEWSEALKRRDYAKAFSKAVVSSRLTKPMVDDAKRLLNLLGIPHVQASSEAEAQAAYIAMRGDAWASSSRDFDSLLFGTPKLVRNLTLTGKEFLPSKGLFRRLVPELIILEEFLSRHQIRREQLIDAAILMGTDFNQGINGFGPKRSIRTIREFGRIESLPSLIKNKVAGNYDEVRRLFLEPDVDRDYAIHHDALREDELYEFLCGQKGFSRERVEKVVERTKKYRLGAKQIDLEGWFRTKNNR